MNQILQDEQLCHEIIRMMLHPDFEIKLNGNTKIIGKNANGPANMSYRVNGNIFIVGIQNISNTKVVDAVVIQVTGERSFKWLAAGRMTRWYGSFDTCDGRKDFISDCFKTKSDHQEDYNVELVAVKGTFSILQLSNFWSYNLATL